MKDGAREISPAVTDTGTYGIVEQADPSTRLRYRHLQIVSIMVATLHALAVFITIYLYREGNLSDFSSTRMMHFVATNTLAWKTGCVVVALSSSSFLLQFIAFKQVLRMRHSLFINTATFFAAIAVAFDLLSAGSMTILFPDLSLQLVNGSAYSRQLLMLEAWKTLNQVLTQSFVISNSLYSLSGLTLAGAIVSGFGLPRWLGWTSIPVWLAGLSATFFTLAGDLSWATVLMFAMAIAFIIWTITAAVAIDPYAHELTPDQPNKQN